VQLGEPAQDEFDAAIGSRQRVEDVAIEHEDAPHPPGHLERVMQRRVVVGAQFAPKPDQGAID
jgi:hypothetical protein